MFNFKCSYVIRLAWYVEKRRRRESVTRPTYNSVLGQALRLSFEAPVSCFGTQLRSQPPHLRILVAHRSAGMLVEPALGKQSSLPHFYVRQ
jgi:hypothetical protein